MINKELERKYRLKERSERFNRIKIECLSVREWGSSIMYPSIVLGHLNFDIKAFINDTEKRYTFKSIEFHDIPPEAFMGDDLDIEADMEPDYDAEDDDEQYFENDDDYFDNPVPDFCDDPF